MNMILKARYMYVGILCLFGSNFMSYCIFIRFESVSMCHSCRALRIYYRIE